MFQEGVIKVTVVSSFTIQFDVKHACATTASLGKLPIREARCSEKIILLIRLSFTVLEPFASQHCPDKCHHGI